MRFYAPPTSNNSNHGFTLLELLVTVAILAIVAVIAAPSLQNFVLNNRIRTQAAALTATPQNEQADDTDCKTLTLTHLGEQSATGDDKDSCW